MEPENNEGGPTGEPEEQPKEQKRPAEKKESRKEKRPSGPSPLHRAGSYFIKNHKTSLALSFSILAVVLASLLFIFATTGSLVEPGLQFTGGTQAVIPLETLEGVNAEAIEGAFALEFQAEARATLEKPIAGGSPKLSIETNKEISEEELQSFLQDQRLSFGELEFNEIGPVVGAAFFAQTQNAILIAFIAMGLIVLFIYRRMIVSLAVILASFSDIMLAVLGMNIFGMKLTLASLAGLLMLIGYSVDTDILLSTRTLKRQVEDIDRVIASSAKTGLMMTATALFAVTVLYVFSSAPEIKQISLILIFGLLADVIFTWLQNAGILKWWYLKRRAKFEGKAHAVKKSKGG